jgi:soluble lytic murein transglycosylase-like protein
MRLLFMALLLSAAALYYSNAGAMLATESQPDPQPEPQPDPQPDSLIGELENMVAKFTVPAKYASAINQAEKANGLPSGLLARVLYRESHFREDIITGAVRSSAGAIGIAQFMPATAVSMGVDPLNPYSAIDGAARYLAQLYRTTGKWSEAVAAYNWGIGNVQRKGLAKAPQETQDYLSEVMQGMGIA